MPTGHGHRRQLDFLIRHERSLMSTWSHSERPQHRTTSLRLTQTRTTYSRWKLDRDNNHPVFMILDDDFRNYTDQVQ